MSAPGLLDLLISARAIVDPENAARAAENALSEIIWGIAGIGQLIWHAHSQGDEPVDKDSMADVGMLVHSLATNAHQIWCIGQNAKMQRDEKAKKTDAANVGL